MTKVELVKSIANTSDIPQSKVEEVVTAVFDFIRSEIKKGQVVQIRNFGKFAIRKVNGRKRQNPRTGEEIFVEEHNVPVFKPFKHLKDDVK